MMMMKNQLFYVLLATIVLTVVSAAATNKNYYVGQYKIQAVYNNQGMEVVLPASNVFSVNINTSSSPDDESVSSSSSSYVVAMKIGNAMTTTMSVTPSGNNNDIVKFGYIMSTRMLPPPEINEVEMTVSDLFRSSSESTTSISFDESDSGMILTITNGFAKLVCVSSEG